MDLFYLKFSLFLLDGDIVCDADVSGYYVTVLYRLLHCV